MSRPLSKTAKHRRQYFVLCEDSFFHVRKFFFREGYKSLILNEFISKFPDYDISIYVLSDRVISNIK